MIFRGRGIKALCVFIFILALTGCGGPAASEEEEPAAGLTQEKTMEPIIKEVDYSSYFRGMKGTAVFFSPEENQYDIYNAELAAEERSPCSTFKIISSLIGLQAGIIDPEDSVRPWSGEQFWMADWNKNLNFTEAFHASCVWYFRQVIDDLGQETIQSSLDALEYGNRDISDWEGRLNANNSNPALTGFWIESSLKISPMQQTEVLARIFEPGSAYSADTLQPLKDVMAVEQDIASNRIYGKTGSGKQNGRWIDAWFVGFTERSGGNTYFAIHLSDSEGPEISSSAAKEIAIQIIGDLY